MKENNLLDNFVSSVLNIDPVYFVENYLTIDGEPFNLSGGYKPFADIYRYICLKAVEKGSLPVILVKGRQVGATTMAAALEAYFMGCGLYGISKKPPMRIMHLFPTLGLAAAYTKDKLTPIIQQSKPTDQFKNNGIPKSFLESRMDTSSPANDNMFFKKFLGGNQIWIESTGLNGDRVRGRTVDALFYDECFPYNQLITTSAGKVSIGKLYDNFVAGNQLPEVLSLNEETDEFEFKKITNAWNRGFRKLVKVVCDSIEIKCTPNHRFLTLTDWVCAENLVEGSMVRAGDSNSFVLVERVEHLNIEEMVYDIEVEDNHNFIVCVNNHTGIIAHNCQDMNEIAIGTVGKVATKGNYGETNQGINVFFGTPKQKGGAYWKMWQSSSQQYFHLHCESCDKHFPLYRPDVNWEEIWLYGFIVRCTHCGHEQDKRVAAEKGKWIPINNDDNFVPKMIGYHINQLYIPTFAKEHIIKQKPGIHQTNSEKIYMNEVLGEFYDGEGGTITKEEIINTSIDVDRSFAKIITPSDNVRVYAGFDWGQKSMGSKQGKSYSCAVVLTAHGPELFSVDFATRLSSNDPEEKKQIVEEMFRRYSVSLSIGDIGDAGDLTHTLQRMHGDTFLGSRASNQVNNHIKYRDDVFPKEIVFERDYYISELIGLLKKGAIRFPGKSYDRVEWLINHCCSMEIKITQNRAGEPIKHYVKGGTPNDGFMALLNAYIGWKFDVTQGFKIKNPAHMQYEKATHNKGSGPILGYIPEW